MKKLLIATSIALAATTASALELGVVGTRDFSGSSSRGGVGLTLSHDIGKLGLTASVERFNRGANDQDRFSLVAGYDLARLGPVTLAPQLGVSYLNNQFGSNGYAMTVGAGATMPVTKQISLAADFARQYGQSRVQAYDGNLLSLGLRYKF